MSMRTPSVKQWRATSTTANGGGRPARLCDSCHCLRARWYCASDDAFLCQDCDATVHSTNPLASRHHRLRLNSTFSSPSTTPGWHNSFKRKPRTPRPHHKNPKSRSAAPVIIQPIVPEIDTSIDDEDDDKEEEEESQLLYQVPIFNPDLAEFQSPPPPLEDIKPATQLPLYNSQPDTNVGSADVLLPTEVELAEFAADMESLLGRGLDAETMVLNFDCESPAITGDDGEKPRMRVGLRLDYEAVITEWSTYGSSPWTDSQRPMFDPGYENCWPDEYTMVGGAMWNGGGVGIIDGGREARVSRYREKRRRRLFSKKIRYEVRKLNAEKRPRMKGRFVKRAAVATGRAF